MSTTFIAPAPPAGWYANPEGSGQRYWDGEHWTDEYRQEPPPPVAQPPAAPAEDRPARSSKKKRRSRGVRILLIGLPILVLLVGGGTVALVIHHNNQVAAQKKAAAAHREAVAAAAAQAAARKRRAAEKLKRDIANLQRDELVTGLEGAVKKDAENDVANGVLNGPITKVQCQPATATDATATPIANYTCLAATSETNGVLSGYRFTAAINVSAGSYTWHLGG
jgi:hypothetical protein